VCVCVCVCVCVRACVCVCVCVCERERGGLHLAPAPRPSLIYCASPLISSLLIPHFKWNVGHYLWGHHKSHLVPWRTGPGDNLKWLIASQSHRTCVADLSSSRHLSQVGSSVNPNLKSCPFRWQYPVNSPTIHLNWSLFNFNRSFVLLTEGPDISPFACLSPVVGSRCFLWFLLVQSLTAL
jgi:hypothetical protein